MRAVIAIPAITACKAVNKSFIGIPYIWLKSNSSAISASGKNPLALIITLWF